MIDKTPPAPPSGTEEKEEVDKALLEKAVHQLQTLAKGNGLPADAITLADFSGEVLDFESHAYFKVDPQISEKRLNGRQSADKIVGSLQDMRNRIKTAIEKISDNPVVRKNTISMLHQREDLGYGIENQAIMLESLNQSFAVHESCQTCSGAAYVQCKYCHGAGYTSCTKCHGSREENCKQCQGRQFIPAANGQQTPCPTCNGRGKTRCLLCQGDGRIECRNCKSKGKMPCEQCAGTGWHSLVCRLKVKAHSHFDYIDPYNEDSESVPPDILPLLEDLGPLLVLDEHADIKINEDHGHVEELKKLSKDDEYIIPYAVRLPWGDISFKINEKEQLSGKLFGFNPVLLAIPPFLEKTTAPGLSALMRAGTESATNAEKNIKAALQFRLPRETLLAAAKYGHRKAFAIMKKRYPCGISDKTLHKIITASDRALKHITLRPRLNGLALGLLMTTLFFATYSLTPVRALFMQKITAPAAQTIMDIMMVAAGGALTTLTIQFTALKSLRGLLGNLLPAAKTKSLLPKAGQSALWGYVGSVVIFFIMIMAAYYTKEEMPVWLAPLF